MTARNLLLDVDSKIPNLALMQISSFLKERGEIVDFRIPRDDPDRVWISCLFTWNASRAKGIARLWECAGSDVLMGGTGIEFAENDGRLVKIADIHIPERAGSLPPDYSLYPGDDRAVGFVARGCNRRCQFCIVPMKEGRIGSMWPIREWNEGRSRILLLDNDLPLGPYHDIILQESIDHGFKLCITQGYDIRCVARGDVSHEGLSMLSENKPWGLRFKTHRLFISWDYLGIENYVRKGIGILLDYGFRPSQLDCYILVGFNTSHEEDLHRYRVLWEEYGVRPFVMIYNNRRDDPWLRAFARWINRRIHKSVPWEEYSRRPEGGII